MRRIMQAIMEVALEHNKADNAKCTELREVYRYMDDVITNVDGARPATGKIREALVVGDFPYYFNRVLSRMVYDRYNLRLGEWRDYTYSDLVPDYSVAERYRFSEFDRLSRRPEKGETKAGYIYEESPVQVQVEDYAKQIDFSHRILVNDDLGQFNNIGQLLADSARRFMSFYVSALYDNAASQAALVALGANYAGTGRLTTANLAIGYNAFVQRVDARRNPITVVPRYLVIPPISRINADTILQSERIAELATNAKNVLGNRGLEIREDPYIAIAPPNVPWYLFADPADIPAVSVARMQTKPNDFYLYAKAPDKIPMTLTGTGDIEISIETTVGARTDDPTGLAGITDAQGIYYSSGTTP